MSTTLQSCVLSLTPRDPVSAIVKAAIDEACQDALDELAGQVEDILSVASTSPEGDDERVIILTSPPPP